MRRIAPLTALAVVPLVSMLVGCDDSARPPDSRETVAVGTLPAELPTVAATTEVPTSEIATTLESAPPATGDPAGAPTDPPRADPSTSDEVPEDLPTRFVDALAGLVEGEIPTQVATTTVRDETGRLRVAVPRAWPDHRTEPSVLPDGSETPSLAASPNLTSFLDGYDTPGLTALVVTEDPQDALDAYAFDEDCLSGRRGPYRSPDLEGRYEVWESCGGTINDIVTIAVRSDGEGETVLLLVQIVGPEDLVALDAALGSLDLRA